MSEMVERVAKALLAALDKADGGGTAWDDAPEEARDGMRTFARSAIEALREPTEAMADVGSVETDSEEDAIECWRAMIDEALK